jgi:hypothetical protein
MSQLGPVKGSRQLLALLTLARAAGDAGATMLVPTAWHYLSATEFREDPLQQVMADYARFYRTLPQPTDTLGSTSRADLRKALEDGINGAIDQMVLGVVAWLANKAVDAAHVDEERAALDATQEKLVPQTSIQSRLAGQGDLAHLRPEERAGLVGPEGTPLPPSHSEIAKDHPPAGAARGSIFYGINHRLAEVATGHLFLQMSRVWSRGGAAPAVNDLTTPDRRLRAGHDALQAEAQRRSAQDAGQAAAEKRSFRQAAPELSAAVSTGPDSDRKADLVALLELVDLFVSHPEDTTWWRGILGEYVEGHLDEVFADIEARNKTRGARTPVK